MTRASQLLHHIDELLKPRWELPPEPGTAPIPPGHVRLYHQTKESNLGSIRHNGILLSKSTSQNAGGGPRAIWASERGFYGKPSDLPTIEFHVPKESWDGAGVLSRPDDKYAALDHVPKENILAVHKPWHHTARYLENDPDALKATLAGEHDNFIHDKQYGPAIRFIKHKYLGHA